MGSSISGVQARNTLYEHAPELHGKGTEEPREDSANAALIATLERAVDIVSRSGPQFDGDRQKLAALLERLEEGRFHLAVLGQFKRGKSTLLNALLGRNLLPTSVVPLTAIPTFVLSGSTTRARVCYLDRNKPPEESPPGSEDLTDFLAKFVTEEANPNNRLGVSHVEVSLSAPILRKGVVLIDTPGIGSTFRHNTEATLNFLPQCDAAVFLVSADPPITEVEVQFLKEVRSKVRRLFFILNKADYLTDAERKTALEFLGKVLREQAGITGEPEIFCVSARFALEARRHQDEDKWKASGMGEVERLLVDFLAHEKATALREAVTGKAETIVEDILLELRLAIKSLEMPLDELEKRTELFRRKIAEAEHQRRIVGDLLAGDKRRVLQLLEEQAEELRSRARSYLESVVQEAAAVSDHASIRETAQKALDTAIPKFFERQFGECSRFFNRHVKEILRPHHERADELISTIRRNAAALFDIPYHSKEKESGFELTQKPYWITHKWMSSLNPLPVGLLDRTLPGRVRRSRAIKRLVSDLDSLIQHNVENLRWSLLQTINNTFLRFASNLDHRLADTITATRGALEASIEKRKQESKIVDAEVKRLTALASDLSGIQEALAAQWKSEGSVFGGTKEGAGTR